MGPSQLWPPGPTIQGPHQLPRLQKILLVDCSLHSKEDTKHSHLGSKGFGDQFIFLFPKQAKWHFLFTLKNWCFWTVVLEKTLESPLECKEIQPVHHKGDQSWVFIGRTDVEAETPILWPPDVKSWLIWKDSDVGKDWGQEEKRMTEDEMVEWHHQLKGHGFGWTPGVGDGQWGLACCDHGVAKSWTRLSNWTELNPYLY